MIYATAEMHMYGLRTELEDSPAVVLVEHLYAERPWCEAQH